MKGKITRRSLVTAVCIVLAFSNVGISRILVGGDRPIRDHGWPSGSLQLANLPTRISFWAGPSVGSGRFQQFEYHAKNTEQFNEALKAFAEIRAPKLELIVHNGPKKGGPIGNPAERKRIDWTFTVGKPNDRGRLYNGPQSYSLSSDYLHPPKIELYVGGGAVQWEKVEVPKYVKLIDRRPGSISPEFAGKGLVRARVFDMATRKPIEGAEVLLIKQAEGKDEKDIKPAKTNKEGFCQIAQIPTGYYEVQVLAEGYVARRQGNWDNYLPEFLKFKIDLARGACVKGLVTDTKGKPIEGLKVRTIDVFADDGSIYPCVGEKSAITDELGRFEICSLPAGSLSLRCESRSLHRKTSIFEQYDIPSDDIKLVMTGTASITGKVVDRNGKRPEGGIILEIEPEGGSKRGAWGHSGYINEEGTFQIKAIPPGKYVITTMPNPRSAKFEPNIGKITVKAGKTYEVEVLHEDVKGKATNIIRKFLERRLKDEQ